MESVVRLEGLRGGEMSATESGRLSQRTTAEGFILDADVVFLSDVSSGPGRASPFPHAAPAAARDRLLTASVAVSPPAPGDGAHPGAGGAEAEEALLCEPRVGFC